MVWKYFYLFCHQKGFLSKFELFAIADKRDTICSTYITTGKTSSSLTAAESILGGILRHFKPFVVRIAIY